jgi:hypothetical protein
VREHFSGCTSDTEGRVEGKNIALFLNGKKYFFVKIVKNMKICIVFPKKSNRKEKMKKIIYKKIFYNNVRALTQESRGPNGWER